MNLLADLTVIFAIAAIVLYVSARMQIPTVVGLLLSGLIAGPFGFGLVEAEEAVHTMAEIGILLLLFTIGMEFSLKNLLKSKRWILIGGGLQVGITSGIVLLSGMLFGLPWQSALFVGFLFSMSSTAIVLHLLQERGKIDTVHGKAIMAILIFQDMIIIPMMLVAPFIAGEGGSGALAVWKLVKGMLIVGLIIFLARTLVPRMLRSIVHTRNQDLFLVAILVICFSTAFITYELGLKLALGAFLAGLIISESEFSYDALSHILPLKKIFTSIFFISIGMLLNTSFFISNLPLILGVTLVVMIVKLLIVSGVAIVLDLSLRNALIVGLSLAQVGEFAFVLAQTGSELNILTYAQNQVFLAVSVFSMAVSPFVIIAAPAISSWVVIHRRVRQWTRRWNIKLTGVRSMPCPEEDHLVIIGYGVNGQNLAIDARKRGLRYSVIEFNEKRVAYAHEEGQPIYAGDARNRDVLLNAAVDKARTVVIAVHDASTAEGITTQVRKLNPQAHIIVRSRFESEVETLKKLGADEVVPEQLEAARRISERTLMRFPVP